MEIVGKAVAKMNYTTKDHLKSRMGISWNIQILWGAMNYQGTWIMDHHSYKESIWLCKQTNDAWYIYYSLHSLVYME